jgi:hypothetical protein
MAKIFFCIRIGLGLLILLQGLSSSVLLMVGPPAAWLAYLFKSERVRNTYSSSRLRSENVSDVFR